MSFGQARDSFFYENTEYTLQAISEGKHLINCADFHLDIEVQFNPSTNNRKGYIGRYFVENNMLYGIKRVYLYSEEVNSEKIFLDFTGGYIIVAPDPGVQCRYFQYLYCDVAYELIFEKENLVGVNDLSKAIKIINTSSRGHKESENKQIKFANHYLIKSYEEEPYIFKEGISFSDLSPIYNDRIEY